MVKDPDFSVTFPIHSVKYVRSKVCLQDMRHQQEAKYTGTTLEFRTETKTERICKVEHKGTMQGEGADK